MEEAAPRHEAGAAIPGYSIRGRLRVSERHVLFDAVRDSDGAGVVLKVPRAGHPRARDLAELRREHRILRGLDAEGVIDVGPLVSWGAGNLALEMERFGRSLADRLRDGAGPLPVDRVLDLGITLARILDRIHRRSVVHKDLTPSNILLSEASGDVRIIDFDHASELSRERQDTTSSPLVGESLPYVSPERTGRTSRDLDYRSDYYSLGVILFELLTGELPFQAEDSLEWVHCHISRPPPLASAVRREVPEGVAAVVARLLAKNAEDRYQSASGLVADLERCREELARHGMVHSFELGTMDIPRSFQVPDRLYGREEQLEQLLSLFDDVVHGASGFLLVHGYAGVGKSALVNALGDAVVRRSGYLVQGKFDRLQQSTPYSALAAGLRGLVDRFLGEPEARLEAWRERILSAVEGNGQILVDLVPSLELVIGKQPPVAELPPTEAQNRFQLVLAEFIRALASPRHPVVLFLDDLQWSDIPSLNLLRRLATARDLGHLLLVGAYRSNEVDTSHPLMVVLDRIAKAREVESVALEPLADEAVQRLVADTLGVEGDRSRPLGDAVYATTRGNPYFVRELLASLHERGAIEFDAAAHRWDWDMDAVQRSMLNDNVVDFVVDHLRALAPETQNVLRLAACIGNRFDLRTLSIIHEQPPEVTADQLGEALRRRLVIPLTGDYRFVGNGSGANGDANPVYRFVHDRVQEAAHALIDEGKRQAVHLSVGRLMLRHGSEEEVQARLVEIVAHLNRGRPLIRSGDERLELARLNLLAGRAAQASAAHEQALEFFQVGTELLPENPWETQHDLTLALARQLQQASYLAADQEQADRWCDEILERARTRIVRAEALSTRTRQYATVGRMAESVEAAMAGLRLLGIDVVETPTDADVEKELARVEAHLAGRPVASLIDADEATDPEAVAALELLMEVFAAAFLSGTGKLFPYLVLKGVNLALVHGAGPESAFAYCAYGMILCGPMGQPARAAEYGRLAVAMNERFDDLSLRSRIIYVYTMFVHHWSNHWASMTPWFLRGIEAGYQSGDLLYLAYSAQDCIIWDPTLELGTASEQQRRYLEIVRDCDYQDSYDSGTLFLQMQLNFRGLTDGTYSLNDDSYQEQEAVRGMRERGFMTGLANYHIYKAEIHALYGDWAGAMEHVRIQEGLVASSMSLPQSVRFAIVSFLTRAQLWPTLDDDEKVAARETLESGLAQMAFWAGNCRENFEHLRLTMEAELARLDGRLAQALHSYDAAIRAARGSGFLRDEGVAAEMAARCLEGAGLSHAAEGYLRGAHSAFDRWGAVRKVERMETDHPWLAENRPGAERDGTSALPGSSAAAWSSLDLDSIMKASRVIAGELVQNRLWLTTLQILMENAGAERGWFVVQRNGDLFIAAQAAGGEDGTVPDPLIPVDAEEPRLPLSVINATLRTGRAMVLQDASASGRFVSDPYITKVRPRSVLCLPLQRADKFSGAVYMENNLTPGAFSEDRLEVLRLLSAQASISMENAQLYEAQTRLIRAQERFVPSQFLENLGHEDISAVGLGEYVARTMSVLFCDLRNFTPLAERLGPRAMIELLNRYFSRLADPIAETGGFIDSYNGDEVMALFGLPADGPVEAGIRMCRVLQTFNRELAAEDGPTLVMGVGVHTGPLVLGTVGGHDRLKCGVVGDTVNVASRIEQLTRFYDAAFLLGQPTVDGLRDPGRFSLRRVDRVAVKGKETGLDIHEVLDAESPERRAGKESTRDALDHGMERYFDRDFRGAADAFRDALARTPDDVVFTRLLERAESYASRPPPEGWEGVEILTHK
ncbi:MAG: GAF domain-containing protein [Gemmatimonadales bacterium]|nr:MAG: GAF domain-containing protein [Gemmatimonadales bacterium]